MKTKTIRAKDVMQGKYPNTLECEFTTQQAPGALPNGTRVEKTDFRPSDAHAIGSKATILGSLGPIPFERDCEVYGYFVEWDDIPGVPVFIAGNRLQEIKAR